MKMHKSKMVRKTSGFSLIEVLVAVVVLSIGLVGLAGLQAKSLVNGVSASYRTQATMLAKDLSEKMRVNGYAITIGDYFDSPTAAETAACETATGCSSEAMAQHDYFNWLAAVTERLPSGDGIVCLDSTPNDGTTALKACDGAGDHYVIKVWWDDGRTGNTGDPVIVVLQAAWRS